MDMLDLIIERDFAAPRTALWAAFTEVEILTEWFGPQGWAIDPDTCVIDARVGGVQKFVMHSLENPEHTSPVDAVYTEVRDGELLVGTDGPHDMTLHMVIELRIELSDAPGGTRLRLTQGPLPAEVIDPSRAGWESSFGKLDRLLADFA